MPHFATSIFTRPSPRCFRPDDHQHGPNTVLRVRISGDVIDDRWADEASTLLTFTTARRHPPASSLRLHLGGVCWIRSFAAAEMTGPMSFPGTMFLACSTIRAMMSSVFETATITDAAMHR